MTKEDIKVNELLDLSETEFSFLFKGLTYPYEVLPLIKQRFDECVRSLNNYEYNRIKDGVYVHKSVTVLKSVYLGKNRNLLTRTIRCCHLFLSYSSVCYGDIRMTSFICVSLDAIYA